MLGRSDGMTLVEVMGAIFVIGFIALLLMRTRTEIRLRRTRALQLAAA